MSLSVSDLAELMEMWEELNLTASSAHRDDDPRRHPGNLTHAAEVCPARFSQGALFYSLSVLYLFIFLAGTAANGLALWAGVRSERARRYETRLYVLNLAVADLCAAATLPVWVGSLLQRGHWPFGRAVCQAAHLVFSVNLFASIFFLTCMSVDRYLASRARHGGGSRRKKVVRRVVCVAVWVVALAASLPDTYFLRVVPSSHSSSVTVCRSVYPGPEPRDWMAGVQLSFLFLGFLLPFPVLAVSYLLLARSLQEAEAAAAGEEEEERERRERRASRNVVLSYIVVFLLCWLPYHAALLLDTLALLGALPFSCALESGLYVALHLTQCLSLLHCCVNPLLYALLGRRGGRHHLVKAFIFKYSTRSGLARLIDGTPSARASEETEYEEVESHAPL